MPPFQGGGTGPIPVGCKGRLAQLEELHSYTVTVYEKKERGGSHGIETHIDQIVIECPRH